MSVNFNVRLNSIESNVSSLQSTLEEGLKNLSKQIEKNTNSTELFNHQYFLLPQSDNPDERLLDDAHAEVIIDGITELNLRTNWVLSFTITYMKIRFINKRERKKRYVVYTKEKRLSPRLGWKEDGCQ